MAYIIYYIHNNKLIFIWCIRKGVAVRDNNDNNDNDSSAADCFRVSAASFSRRSFRSDCTRFSIL